MGVKYGGQIFFGQNPGEAQNHHLLKLLFSKIDKCPVLYKDALKAFKQQVRCNQKGL